MSWLAILWGFAEATLFFVVPDVFFTRTTIASVRRGWYQLIGAIAGAILGGTMMFVVAERHPQQARSLVAHVPFVGAQMIADRDETWRAGTTALFANPLSGVPYKVDAVLAAAHISPAAFIMLSIPLRFERMALSMIVFVPIGLWVARTGDESLREARKRRGLGFHIIFWVVLYGYYWSTH